MARMFGADPLAMLAAYDDDDADVGALSFQATARPSASLAARAVAPVSQQTRKLAMIGQMAVLQAKQEEADQKDHRDAMLGLRPQFLIPCSSAADIAASAAVNLSALPGVACTVTKWVIGSVSAPWFDIFNVASARSILVSGGTGGVPADSFDPDSIPVALDNPDLSGGTPITVTGQNRDALNAHPFRSTFYAIDRNQKRFGVNRVL